MKGDDFVALINITEMVARERLTQLLNYSDCCKCEKCYTDMLAIVLNNIKPQYVNTHKGELFKRISATTIQNSIDMDIAITKAIELVSRSPQHNITD